MFSLFLISLLIHCTYVRLPSLGIFNSCVLPFQETKNVLRKSLFCVGGWALLGLIPVMAASAGERSPQRAARKW